VKYIAVPLQSYWILSLNIYHSLLSPENVVTKLGDNRSLVWCLKDISAVMDFCYFEQTCFKTKEDRMSSMILLKLFLLWLFICLTIFIQKTGIKIWRYIILWN